MSSVFLPGSTYATYDNKKGEATREARRAQQQSPNRSNLNHCKCTRHSVLPDCRRCLAHACAQLSPMLWCLFSCARGEKGICAHVTSYGPLIVKPARLHFARTARGYPTCCPLVRFSHIREHRRCCARRAMRVHLTRCLRTLRARLQSTSGTSGGRARRARRALVRVTCAHGHGNARGDLSEFLAARTCASCWLDKSPYFSRAGKGDHVTWAQGN